MKKGSWAQGEVHPRRKVQSPTGATGVIKEKRHVDVSKNIFFLMETIEGSNLKWKDECKVLEDGTPSQVDKQ